MCQINRHMVAKRLRKDGAAAITCRPVMVQVDSSLVRRPAFNMVRLCQSGHLYKELLLQIMSAQTDRDWKGSCCAAVQQSQTGGSTHISVVQMTSLLDSVYL